MGRFGRSRLKMKTPVDILEDKDLWTRERHSEICPNECMVDIKGYESLSKVLEEAFCRAASGKGRQRHAGGDHEFEDQWILRGARLYGAGGLYFQIGKKLEESFRMFGNQRINELLDCINYCAAAIILEREQREK